MTEQLVVDAGRSSTRATDDARHVLAFMGCALVVVLALNLGYPVFEQWLTPAPPPELMFLSDAEAIDLVSHHNTSPDEQEQIRIMASYAYEDPRAETPASFAPPSDPAHDPEFLFGPAAYPSFHAALQHGRAVEDVRQNARLLAMIAMVVVLGFAVRRVGYRWIDAIGSVIPVIALYVVPKVLWRLTSPVPYWADELHLAARRGSEWRRFGIGLLLGLWLIGLAVLAEYLGSFWRT